MHPGLLRMTSHGPSEDQIRFDRAHFLRGGYICCCTPEVFSLPLVAHLEVPDQPLTARRKGL